MKKTSKHSRYLLFFTSIMHVSAETVNFSNKELVYLIDQTFANYSFGKKSQVYAMLYYGIGDSIRCHSIEEIAEIHNVTTSGIKSSLTIFNRDFRICLSNNMRKLL